MRLFVCSLLAPAHQAFYARQIGALLASSQDRSGGRLLREIPPLSAHVTYAFLKHPGDDILDETIRAVGEAAARHAPIAIDLGAPFILYARSEARLVCAPIGAGARELAQLSEEIVQAVMRRLPRVEVSGMKSAHVTLARFRKSTQRRDAAAIDGRLRQQAARHEPRADRFVEVQTMSSDLTSAGPRYDVAARATLGAAARA